MIGGHGGNIYQLALRLGCRPAEISDMSANVNPLGPMPALVDHLKGNLSVIAALPEADAGTVVATFAQLHGIDPRLVMAGNGTTELIYMIPRALKPQEALVVGPTYADYRDACAMNRVHCDHLICRAEDDFVPDMQALRSKAAASDLVFFCNPNNPTGHLTRRSDLEELCRRLPDTVFVIDESYLPFAPNPAEYSMIASELPNVMVLNSMSKAFRIPGLRIGFVMAPPILLAKLTPFALPWSVNSLAQAAVQWLMAHPEQIEDFLASSRHMLEGEKSRMATCLHRQTGIRCFPSSTSFLLMRLPAELDAPTVWDHMANHRILIRDCANFVGLSEAFVRLSLKSVPENCRAAELLVQLCRHFPGKAPRHGR